MKKSQKIQIYAQTMLEIAREAGKIEEFLREFELVVQLENEVPDLKKILELPIATIEEKEFFVNTTLKNTFSDTFLKFIRMLIQKRHFYLFPAICLAYRELADKQAGRVRATATTAFPLTPQDITDISSMLTQHLKQQVVVKNVVNPEIMGGVILQAGDLYVDSSLKRKLDQLRNHLLVVSKTQH